MSAALTFDATSLADTRRLGFALGQIAEPGVVIGLEGAMGAGKTTFTRAVAEGLGVPDSRVVTSPTFLLIQEYEGRIPLYHFDTYRLRSVDDFSDLGVDEYFYGEGICIVEWADRVRDQLPAERIDVRVSSPTGKLESRRFEIGAVGARWISLVARWKQAVTDDRGLT